MGIIDIRFDYDNIDSYFQASLNIIAEEIESQMHDSFIYANLSYFDFDQRNLLKTCGKPSFNKDFIKKPNSFGDTLNNAFQEINKEDLFSFTNFLVRHEKLYLLLETSDQENISLEVPSNEDYIHISIPHFEYLDEEIIKNNLKPDDLSFFNIGLKEELETTRKSLINTILFYKLDIVKHIESVEENICFYFIRPSLRDDSYKGILYLSSFTKIDGKYLTLLSLSITHFFQRIILYEKEVNAITSAIAAIMSRNMSHNLGSHVLSSLVYNINMPYDSVVLYKYLQHRMDFIAQITTDWPEWTYPVWFVRDLMRKFYTQKHVLNYIIESEDLSAYEFQNKNPNDDPLENQNNKLIIEIEKNRLMPKVISAYEDSQDFRLNHDTDIQLAIPGGTVGYHAFYVILENIIRNTAKHEWSSINVLKPNNCKEDISLNNKIKKYKNTQIIKYKNFLKSLVKEEKEISNKFRNQFDKQYEKEINEEVNRKYDNKRDFINDIIEHNSRIRNLRIIIRFHDENKKEYTRFEVFSNVQNPFAGEIAEKINRYLQNGFIKKETGELINKNWGLAEMKIALGFLNKVSPVEIGRNNENILLDEEREVVDKNKIGIGLIKAKVIDDNKFGYEFIIPKPKEILIILDENEFDADLNNKLKQFNIHLTHQVEKKKLDYELVVIKNTNLIKKLKEDDKWINYFPNRILIVTEDEVGENNLFSISHEKFGCLTDIYDESIKSDIDIEKPNDFKIKLFTHWLLRYIGNTDKIYLHGNTVGKNNNSHMNDIIIITEEEDKNPLHFSKDNFEEIVGPNAFANHYKMRTINLNESKKKILREVYRIRTESALNKFSKKLFFKYDEDITTLPRAFRASQVGSLKDSVKGDVFAMKLLSENIEYVDGDKISKLEEEEKKKLIYLERHGELKDKIDYYYAETLSGAQNYFNLLINGNEGSSEYLNKKVLVQLLENAYSGILILDERVFEYNLHASIEVRKQLEYANIFTYDDKKINDIECIKIVLDNTYNDKKIKFLIIHQGIIDKISENRDIKESLIKLKKLVPYVIVTSGRGMPEKIPKGFKFIPYSTIAETVMKPYHEKFLLTNILLKLISYGK